MPQMKLPVDGAEAAGYKPGEGSAGQWWRQAYHNDTSMQPWGKPRQTAAAQSLIMQAASAWSHAPVHLTKNPYATDDVKDLQ